MAGNLEYVTPKENMDHAWESGLIINIGENHGNSKLTDHEVKVIKELLFPVFNNTEISKLYNVSFSLIGMIRNGKIWKHV